MKQTRAVLVTGGAKRLGRAIALHLGKAGWSVAVHYNSSQGDAEETVAMLHESGTHAAALNADLSMEDDTQRLIERAHESVGPLTALINNASVFEADTISTMTRESWT
ncbi:MAG TPA: SDR family NAD(P)-dependent oxidoreductase, partial [Micropepsaceae bacterium]|nr:SDR family NAD(P)-dependent oxidoreductase [Micropepsaceae bacterium]